MTEIEQLEMDVLRVSLTSLYYAYAALMLIHYPEDSVPTIEDITNSVRREIKVKKGE